MTSQRRDTPVLRGRPQINFRSISQRNPEGGFVPSDTAPQAAFTHSAQMSRRLCCFLTSESIFRFRDPRIVVKLEMACDTRDKRRDDLGSS